MRARSLAVGSRLDLYVVELYALSYAAAFFLVVGLFLILDMATHLDDYLAADKSGGGPPTLLVGKYYLLQMPFLYLQMSPYVTLVAGMFTGAKLSRSNEVVAALSAGISVRRLLLPVYAAACALAIGMFVLREQATAGLGRARDLIQDRLAFHRPQPVINGLVVWDKQGRAVALRSYEVGDDPADSSARGLTASDREGDTTISIDADAARPLSGGRWQLENGYRLQDDGHRRSAEVLPILDDWRFTPEDVELYWRARERPMDLSYSDLRLLTTREPTNLQYQTLVQYDLTFPLAGLVLLLVGLPFVVGDERGKAGERIARGFFLCVAYFGVDFVARTLGLQGAVGPIFSGWLPLVLFGSLGIALTVHMRS